MISSAAISEVLICAACRLSSDVTRADRLQNIKPDKTPLLLDLSQMSPNREDSCDLSTFVVCKETTSLGKHTNKKDCK